MKKKIANSDLDISNFLCPPLYRLSPPLYRGLYQLYCVLLNCMFLMRNISSIEAAKKFIPKTIIREYEREMTTIEKLNKELFNYPLDYNVSNKTSLLIYYLVRKHKPKVVVETGVANGLSTRMILAAMNKNGEGKLISVEVRSNVGDLLQGIDTKRWTLVVGKPKTAFLSVLKKIRSIDVFLHDSDHSYKNMKFEFKSALPKISKNGLIISDDVYINAAFSEFAQENNLKMRIFPSFTKSFGVLSLKN